MKKLGTLLVLFLSVIALVACASGKKDAASGQKLKVVATNSIIADITKNIAGDKIDLHSIVPIGQDPHEYEPLPEDVKKTSEADLIFIGRSSTLDSTKSDGTFVWRSFSTKVLICSGVPSSSVLISQM